MEQWQDQQRPQQLERGMQFRRDTLVVLAHPRAVYPHDAAALQASPIVLAPPLIRSSMPLTSILRVCRLSPGPYKINGVPLRRVAAAYVIATSTKVDVAAVDVSKINDAFFARSSDASSKKDASGFITEKKEKAPVAKERTEAQAAVDKAVLPLVKAVPNLFHYLNAKFSLTNGQKPHLLAF